MISVEMEIDTLLDGLGESDHIEIINELMRRHSVEWLLIESDIELDEARDIVMDGYTASLDDQIDNLYVQLSDKQKKNLLLRSFGDLI